MQGGTHAEGFRGGDPEEDILGCEGRGKWRLEKTTYRGASLPVLLPDIRLIC